MKTNMQSIFAIRQQKKLFKNYITLLANYYNFVSDLGISKIENAFVAFMLLIKS